MPRTPTHPARRPRLSPVVPLASALLALVGCNAGTAPAPAPTPQPQPQPPSASDATGAGSAGAAAAATPKDEVKIMVEKWENGNTKFWNEMRRDASGKWQKNGLGRAYYANGVLEREGMYRDGKRVGRWQFYDQEGKPSMVDERGDGTLPGTR